MTVCSVFFLGKGGEGGGVRSKYGTSLGMIEDISRHHDWTFPS